MPSSLYTPTPSSNKKANFATNDGDQVFSPGPASSSTNRLNDSLKFPTKGKVVRGNPGLIAAVEREDFDDLIQKNGEYISRLLAGQGDTMDSLTDMVDALGGKISESSSAATDLVEKLSALDGLIDEEKRKWIIQNEAEKSAELISKSKNLIASPGRKSRNSSPMRESRGSTGIMATTY
jgi:hypothetical protein